MDVKSEAQIAHACFAPETAAQRVAASVNPLVGTLAVCYLASRQTIGGDVAVISLLVLLLPLEIVRRFLSLAQARVGATALATRVVETADKGRHVATVVLALVSVGTALEGCPQSPYRHEPCGVEQVQRCSEGRPQSCHAGQWVPAGDLACSAVGGVCEVVDGVARCASSEVRDGSR
jgi:hypothetical protein